MSEQPFSEAQQWAFKHVQDSDLPCTVDALARWTGGALVRAFEAGAASVQPPQVDAGQHKPHSAVCGWWAHRVPVECTCGAITDADILRAQLAGEPLPRAHAQFMGLDVVVDPSIPPGEFRLAQPRPHAQFKMRGAGHRHGMALPRA